MDFFNPSQNISQNLMLISRIKERISELENLREQFDELTMENSGLKNKIQNLKWKVRNYEDILRANGYDEDFDIEAHDSSPVSDRGSNSDNDSPLFIYLIIDKVFSYLPPEDLRSCRLVCTTWRECSFPHLKTRSPSTAFTNTKNSPDRGQNKFLTLIELLEKRSTQFPWTKFKLTSNFLIMRNEFLLRRFFDRCSGLVEDLEFEIGAKTNVCLSILAEEQIFWSLKNLSFSIIEPEEGYENLCEVDLPGTLITIGETACNLEKISIKSCKSSEPEIIHGLLKSIELCKFPKLQILHLPRGVCSKYYGQLAQFNLSTVKEISLSFQENFEENFLQNLEKFLQSLNQLEKLILENVSDKIMPALNSTVFKSLLSLEIQHNLKQAKMAIMSQEMVNYSQNFPRLKQLKFKYTSSASSTSSKEHFYLTNLPFFSTRSIYKKCTSQSLTKLDLDVDQLEPNISLPICSKLFPQIKSLKIRLIRSDFNFSTIFANFSHLEELELVTKSHDLHLDEKFTGYSPDKIDIEEIIKSKRFPLPFPSDSIANLKCLKKLQFDWEYSKAYLPQIGLSDVSGYFLIYHLEKLQILALGPTKISKECFHRMCEKLIVMHNGTLWPDHLPQSPDFET